MIRFTTMAAALAASAMSAAAQDCGRAATQRDINSCASHRYETAERELGVVYTQVLALRHGTDAQERIKSAQRQWLRSRDTQCAGEAAPYAGGSMHSTVEFGCLERLTRERISKLQGR